MVEKDILNATVKQREVFSDLVAASENLQLAEIPQWAGLGGVRYIPDVWLSQVHTDATKHQLLSVRKSIAIQSLIHLIAIVCASSYLFAAA